VLFHGSGRFEFITRARVPKTKRKAVSSLAAGLAETELGTIDAELLIAFIWQIAGRPENAAEGWRWNKPLVIVLDNYSVHAGKRFQEERKKWKAADIGLFYLRPVLSAACSICLPTARNSRALNRSGVM
jgi:hypothetical protein